MVSMSIHRFGSGLCTDSQVIIYYYHLLVNLFDLIDLYYSAYCMMVLNALF